MKSQITFTTKTKVTLQADVLGWKSTEPEDPLQVPSAVMNTLEIGPSYDEVNITFRRQYVASFVTRSFIHDD